MGLDARSVVPSGKVNSRGAGAKAEGNFGVGMISTRWNDGPAGSHSKCVSPSRFRSQRRRVELGTPVSRQKAETVSSLVSKSERMDAI